jgi:hypothetical protein
LQQQQFLQQQQQQQSMSVPPRGMAAGVSVARGLSPPPPLPPPPPPPAGDSSAPSAAPVKRGPPAVKGGVVPAAALPEASTAAPLPTTNMPIASGLSGQLHPLQMQQQQQQPPMLRPRIIPQQRFRHVAQQQRGPRLPCGSRMTHSDVRFVVGKVLQTTETHDPFNDDFYFIQVPSQLTHCLYICLSLSLSVSWCKYWWYH